MGAGMPMVTDPRVLSLLDKLSRTRMQLVGGGGLQRLPTPGVTPLGGGLQGMTRGGFGAGQPLTASNPAPLGGGTSGIAPDPMQMAAQQGDTGGASVVADMLGGLTGGLFGAGETKRVEGGFAAEPDPSSAHLMQLGGYADPMERIGTEPVRSYPNEIDAPMPSSGDNEISVKDIIRAPFNAVSNILDFGLGAVGFPGPRKRQEAVSRAQGAQWAANQDVASGLMPQGAYEQMFGEPYVKGEVATGQSSAEDTVGGLLKDFLFKSPFEDSARAQAEMGGYEAFLAGRKANLGAMGDVANLAKSAYELRTAPEKDAALIDLWRAQADGIRSGRTTPTSDERNYALWESMPDGPGKAAFGQMIGAVGKSGPQTQTERAWERYNEMPAGDARDAYGQAFGLVPPEKTPTPRDPLSLAKAQADLQAKRIGNVDKILRGYSYDPNRPDADRLNPDSQAQIMEQFPGLQDSDFESINEHWFSPDPVRLRGEAKSWLYGAADGIPAEPKGGDQTATTKLVAEAMATGRLTINGRTFEVAERDPAKIRAEIEDILAGAP